MTKADEIKKVTTRILGDETLANWARTSIRYNTGREYQALDFMAKVKAHKVTLIATVDVIKGALSAIEKADRGN